MSSYPNRRGAALVAALVLLALIGVVASTSLTQILRDRQETRMDLVRQQARLLLDDALRNAEAQRKSDAAFSDETLTLDQDQQPFPGTFLITTTYRDDRFEAEVQYWGIRAGRGREKPPCLTITSP